MKTNIRFSQNLKKYLCVSAAVILIGIVCNIIFGTHLDIQFSGGTIVNYTFTGNVEETELKDYIQNITEQTVTTNVSENLIAGDTSDKQSYVVAVQFSGDTVISPEQQQDITTKLQEKYKDNDFELRDSTSVEASMGLKFFLKCLVAIAIAAVIMVLYVAFRFRNIGGLSAGCMALVALAQDIVVIYFTFVILRLPIDSNFMAVILMIIGYSLNDTIVIYDRVRENRRLMDRNTPVAELYNTSANQMFKRTIFTSFTTVMAIGAVLVISIIFGLDSVRNFALPMMLGVIYGCYSSNCIAGPLWVAWQNRKAAKAAK